MKKVNGFTYSTKQYDGYKSRCKFRVIVASEPRSIYFDVYTDSSTVQSTYEVVRAALIEKYKNDYKSSKITFWCSAEDDASDSEIIEGLLDSWEQPVGDTNTDLILRMMSQLKDHQRVAIFDNYCKHCGSIDDACQCWNDL